MGTVFRIAFEWTRRLAVLGALALAACAAAPVPKPEADAPGAWRNAAHDANLGPAPDLRAWWRAFGDPDLDRLIDRALADNLTLKQAALRLAAARAMSGRASAAYAPELGAHTFAEPAPDSSASYFQAGFDAKWELGLFGRAESSARIADAEAGLAGIDVEAARVSVVAEVARVYVELRSAERRLDLLTRIAESSKAKNMLIATRERLRLASAADAAGSDAERASAEAALVEPRLAIVRSRQQLAVLLGTSDPAALALGERAPPRLDALEIGATPADFLRTRPEIRRAELSILKAAGELGIARADLYPRLALGGSLTYAARVIGHTRLADADSIVTAGPIIDIPIFDWGARRAVVTARDAELQAALLGYRQAVLDGVAEVETALSTLAAEREHAAVLARAVAAEDRGSDAVATLRRVGLADDVDRENASTNLAQAELAANGAEEARDLAFIALYKALGGAPLPQPEPGS